MALGPGLTPLPPTPVPAHTSTDRVSSSPTPTHLPVEHTVLNHPFVCSLTCFSPHLHPPPRLLLPTFPPPSSTMAASTSSAPVMEFNCDKWADCSCTDAGDKCLCGSSCGCGSVSIEQVKDVMAKVCPYSDCGTCGVTCKCGSECSCGGTTQKSKAQWVEWVKTNSQAGCACKSGGTCLCPAESCTCGGGG